MNDARTQLLARREAILVRIADQRRMLARDVRALHRPLLCVELAASTWRLLRRHPGLMFGAAAITVWPRGRPGQVIRRGFVVWKIVQGLRRACRAQAASAN